MPAIGPDADAGRQAIAAIRSCLATFGASGRIEPGEGLDLATFVKDATPMQVALAWLLQRSPNILLIPGTSSVTHLRENLAASRLPLSPEVLAELDGIAA